MTPITINGNTIYPGRVGLYTIASDANEDNNEHRLATDASSTNYILIQSTGTLSDAQKRELQSLRVKIHDYVGHNTYLCKYEPADLDRLRQLKYLQYADIYHPTLKIQADIKPQQEAFAEFALASSQAAASEESSAKEVEVVICLQQEAQQTSSQVASELISKNLVDGDKTVVYPNRIDTIVPTDKLEGLALIDSIRVIEEASKNEPMLNRARTVTQNPVYADDNTGTTNECTGVGEVVHIADTGFDKGLLNDVHKAFSTSRLLGFYNPNPATPTLFADTNSHGTHVAGCALANGDTASMGGPDTGIAGKLQAPAYNSNFVITCMLDAKAVFFNGPFDSVVSKPYTEKSARISNHSYGPHFDLVKGQQGYKTIEAGSVDEFIFDHPDFLVVFAAGNDGGVGPAGTSQIQGSAIAKNALAIGNSLNIRKINGRQFDPTQASEADTFTFRSTSSRGFSAEGRAKPDLAAPGTAILSALSRLITVPPTTYGVSTDTSYFFDTGTSMAAPHVAGCAAVLREALQKQKVASPSAAFLKALLINGAVEMFVNDPAPNKTEGFGRVNLTASLKSIPESEFGGFVDGPTLQQGASSVPIIVDVPAPVEVVPGGDTYGMTLKVTLTWTDRPGKDLVNQLGLVVISASKQRRHGNMGAKDMTPTPDTFDTINNVQQVVWSSIPQGKTSIIVRCTKALAVGEKVAYALAWSLE